MDVHSWGFKNNYGFLSQAPIAFAGYAGGGDLSKLMQAPLAFSGRARTHRVVEVGFCRNFSYQEAMYPRKRSAGVRDVEDGCLLDFLHFYLSNVIGMVVCICAGDEECLCHEVESRGSGRMQAGRCARHSRIEMLPGPAGPPDSHAVASIC